MKKDCKKCKYFVQLAKLDLSKQIAATANFLFLQTGLKS